MNQETKNFVELAESKDEDKCIEYINKHTTFYNNQFDYIIYGQEFKSLTPLMFVCELELIPT